MHSVMVESGLAEVVIRNSLNSSIKKGLIDVKPSAHHLWITLGT